MNLAAKRPVAIWMGFAAISITGIIAFYQLPITTMNGIAYPGLTIETEYSGIDPEKIEEVISRPLEDSISTIGGIEQLFSVSEQGKSRINIEFTSDSDIDLKALEVRERTDLVSASFPAEVQKPLLLRYDPEQKPIIIAALASRNRTIDDLREIADRELKREFQAVDGVSEVIVAGGRIKEVTVACSSDKMQAYKLGMSQISQAIQRDNLNLNTGRVTLLGSSFPLHVKAKYRSIFDLENTVILSTNKKRILLKDIAQIHLSYREPDSASRRNGQEKVTFHVHKEGQANLLEVSNRIQALSDTLRGTDYSFEIVYDKAALLRSSIKNIVVAAVAGSALAFFILSVFYTWRMAAYSGLVLTFTLLFQFLCLRILGASIDMLVISGQCFSSGLSFLFSTALCQSRIKSYEMMRYLFQRSFAMAVFLLISYAVIAFTTREVKIIYGGLAITIVSGLFATIVASYVSLAFLGVMPGLVGVPTGRPYNLAMGALTFLVPWDRFFLRHHRPVLILILLGAPFFFYFSRTEFSPRLSRKEIQGSIELPSGHSFHATDAISRQIEQKVNQLHFVSEVSSRTQAGQSSLTVILKEGVEPSTRILDALSEATEGFEPAFAHFSSGEDSQTGSLKEVTVHISGENLSDLDKHVRLMAAQIQAIKGVQNLVLRYKPPRPELQIHMDRFKVARSGLNAHILGTDILYAVRGGVASKYIDRNLELDIRVRHQGGNQKSIDDIRRHSFNTEKMSFPLSSLVEFRETEAPIKIYRKNKRRTLSFSFTTEDSFRSIRPEIIDLGRRLLPSEYKMQFDKALEKQDDSARRYYLLLGFAVLIAFMYLSGYFESFREGARLLSILPFIFFIAIAGIVLFQGYVTVLSILQCTAVFSVAAAVYQFESQFGLSSIFMYFSRFLGFALILVFYLPFILIIGDGGNLMRNTLLPPFLVFACLPFLLTAIRGLLEME
ncbi:MAG: efflux RND transporter permease subunit [Spirochaetales bacterium]|nr:efflux RND transporter permease subunit [Spirochaetales bacterium]